jgi:diguanylate cyclase (GGDEF)-like protein
MANDGTSMPERRTGTAPTLDQVLACPSLPSLPAVAAQILELTRQPDSTLKEIASVVENDPALAAKILRTVNSSYYRLSSPCPTVARAVPYLGLTTVKSLVLGFSLINVGRAATGRSGLAQYWRHCLYSAAASRLLARRSRACDPDEAFSAALMQDVGMLALHVAMGPAYADLVARTFGDHRRLADVEREVLGFDHTAVGGRLAERWGLPPQLVTAIRRHHDLAANDFPALVHVVALGGDIGTIISLPNPGQGLLAVQARAKEWLGLDADAISSLMGQIGDNAQELSALFEVSAGEPLDVNWLLAQAEEASVIHQLSIAREAQTLRQTNQELTRLAVTDGLTNVANRKRFDEELASRFDQARAFKGALGMVMVDADRFKQLNDGHGHQVGDAVLIELAARLKKTVRGVDLVCRYGGEEFGVILPGASLKDAASIAERLRVAVASAPIRLPAEFGELKELSVTVSLGAAVYETGSSSVITSPSLLLKAADKALYAAKQAGRNCVRVLRVDSGSAAA